MKSRPETQLVRPQDSLTTDESFRAATASQKPSEQEALSFWRGLWNRSKTVNMFKGDRLLLVAFTVLAFTCTLPLWLTAFVPLVDLGTNIGAASLIDDVAFNRGIAAEYYAVNWFPTPYWGSYAIMSFFEIFFGPFVAAKAIVLLNLLGLPLAFMRLLLALDRNPRVGLLAFMVSWDLNMMWGWVSFSLSMFLALYLLARLIEVRSVKQALRLMPLASLLSLSHVHGVAFFGLAGVALTVWRGWNRERFLQVGIVMAGPALMGLPWLIQSYLRSQEAQHAQWHITPHLAKWRVSSLFQYTFDFFPGEWASPFTAAGFLTLLLAPIVLGSLSRRRPEKGSTLTGVAIVASLALLYMSLPIAVMGPTPQVHTYPRYATYLLLCLLLLPSPKLDGESSWVLPSGLLATVSFHGAVAVQAAEYGKATKPYLAVIDAIAEHSRVLPLDIELNDPSLQPWGALGQIHGWLAGEKSAFDPHLFDYKHMPLHYNHPMTPYPNWSTIIHGQVDYPRLRGYYDYVIVYPKSRDPLGRYKKELEHVMDSGKWRLYKVKPEVLHPKVPRLAH